MKLEESLYNMLFLDASPSVICQNRDPDGELRRLRNRIKKRFDTDKGFDGLLRNYFRRSLLLARPEALREFMASPGFRHFYDIPGWPESQPLAALFFQYLKGKIDAFTLEMDYRTAMIAEVAGNLCAVWLKDYPWLRVEQSRIIAEFEYEGERFKLVGEGGRIRKYRSGRV